MHGVRRFCNLGGAEPLRIWQRAGRLGRIRAVFRPAGFVLLTRAMRGSRSFKELDVYVLSVEFRREIVRLTSRAPVCRDFDFVKQIRNAARGGPKEHR